MAQLLFLKHSFGVQAVVSDPCFCLHYNANGYRTRFNGQPISGTIIPNAYNKTLIPEIRKASLDVIRYSRDIERIIRNDHRYKKILEPSMLELSVISESSNWAQIKENIGKDLIGAISVLKQDRVSE